ncbi:MAG: hypothetical protein JRI97_00890 [Deltaproteobacteria bacterium]|nr:hypothetical protein [Deltaproteobacteria bacterium]
MGLGRMLELKRRFAEGETPDINSIKGRYAVRLVTGLLPDIRFFGHSKFFPPDVTATGGGYNEFLGHVRLGNFRLEQQRSILPDQEKVALINYDRPGNPLPLKILKDELKEVGRDNYLGRGVFKLGPVKFKAFYFTLEKLND